MTLQCQQNQQASASGGDDGMDTSYPSVPTDRLSAEWSSNGTVVSLQYECLVVHNKTTTTAHLVIPGVSSATANRKATVQEGGSSLASAASGDIQQLAKTGVIATVIAVSHSTTRAMKDSMVKVAVVLPPCNTHFFWLIMSFLFLLMKLHQHTEHSVFQ
jgi:hypothetical protein